MADPVTTTTPHQADPLPRFMDADTGDNGDPDAGTGPNDPGAVEGGDEPSDDGTSFSFSFDEAAAPPPEPEASLFEKRLSDRQGTIDRQGQELGELRAMVRMLQEQQNRATEASSVAPSEFDTDAAVSDPTYIPKFVEAVINSRKREFKEEAKQEVMEALGQELAPLTQVRAVQRVSQSNPLAEAALSNPTVISNLRKLGENSTAQQLYSGEGGNVDELRLKAKLFDIIGHTWAKQKNDRAAARQKLRVSRPDKAGAGSPGTTSEVSRPPTTGAEDLERIATMSGKDAAKFFSNLFNGGK
jgi:hypothetical protein